MHNLPTCSNKFKYFSAPLSAPFYSLVPKLTQTEDWVDAIRVFIRDTLGNKNWQIRKGERDKVRLVVRFDDGTRKTWYLPYLWQNKTDS